MATINMTDEELSAAKSCVEVLIAQQAARAPGDDDYTVLKKALVQVVLQRERERRAELERGRAFAEHLGWADEWRVKDCRPPRTSGRRSAAAHQARLRPLPGTGDLENVGRAPVVALKTRLQRGADYVWQAYEEVQNWWEPVTTIAHALRSSRSAIGPSPLRNSSSGQSSASTGCTTHPHDVGGRELGVGTGSGNRTRRSKKK
ncbi:hypothetical protein RI054_12g62810 [Pseudoscourfieldia marina]